MVGRMTSQNPIWSRIGLLVAAVAAVALRFRFLPQTLGEKRIYLFGADPYYHVRRARLLVERFPDLVYTDPFQNFPHCEPCSSLPAGFDLALAALSHLMPAETLADRVALAGVLLVPILGLVTVALVWHLGTRFLPGPERVAAVFGAALLPAFVDNSFAGRPDHHVLDPLTCLAMVALTVRSVQHYGSGRRWLAPALSAGLVGGLALISFPSALVTVTVTLGAGLLAAFVVLLRRENPVPLARSVGLAGLVAGLMQWGFMALFTPCFGSSTLISNTIFPGLLGMVTGLVAGGLGMLCQRVEDRRRRVLFALTFLAVGVVIAGGALAVSAGLRNALGNWLYVMAGNVIPELSPEWRPLLRTPAHWFTGKFTWAFVAIPPGLYLLMVDGWRNPGKPLRLLLGSLAAVLVPLAFLQGKYFVHLYAPVALFAMVVAVGRLARTAHAHLPLAGIAKRAVAGLAALVLLAVLSLEPMSHYRAVELIHWQTVDVLELLEWVREHTPEADEANPEYGIMNTWETGFWVAETADRPVYANNFVAAPPDSVYIEHLASAYRWLLEPTADPLQEAMSQLRTPYLLLIPVDGGKLFGFAQLVDRDPSEWLVRDEQEERWRVGPGFLDTAFAQLFAHQGSATGDRACVAGLQLLRTSSGSMPLGNRTLPVAQLYRRVAGAMLQGRAEPGTAVRIGVIIATPAGTDAPFECSTVADGDGRWSLRFPYASTPPEGVSYRSPVLLILGRPGPNNLPAPVHIDVGAVESGGVVDLSR